MLTQIAGPPSLSLYFPISILIWLRLLSLSCQSLLFKEILLEILKKTHKTPGGLQKSQKEYFSFFSNDLNRKWSSYEQSNNLVAWISALLNEYLFYVYKHLPIEIMNWPYWGREGIVDKKKRSHVPSCIAPPPLSRKTASLLIHKKKKSNNTITIIIHSSVLLGGQKRCYHGNLSFYCFASANFFVFE